MLDFNKLARQMEGISQHLQDEATATQKRLNRARETLAQASDRLDELISSYEQWSNHFGFNAAFPIEPLDTVVDIQSAPQVHTVISTDGSQMAPSHHEIAYCYLINTGRVVFYYGQNRAAILDSLPEAFYRQEDLYVSRQWGIRTDEWMAYQRTVSEAAVLAELGVRVATEERGELDEQLPALAMVDGSLIYWHLEPLPGGARDRLLPPILEAWETLQHHRIPLVGYLSSSRSGEALNFLRLAHCPHPEPNCMVHCGGQTDKAPCQVLHPLRDSSVLGSWLKPGQRSGLWRSSARILEQYREQVVYFCYLNVGKEIARVEFPQWVVEDAHLLEQALSLTLAQVAKGYGYPIALSEAHNQAVVRGGDRHRFFLLLEQQMIKAGLKNIGTSYKEARKRGSIA
ncbi:MAG: DNA double-strand break repair nuclease NurA [Roseofilum sp. SBFL]|uniref:DNA double-strand break repair nuclease NurA n=1 Tax=unclassified Roseofilum TaxID=2620099 RepID=UPI001B0B857F|nr:MULTISPECIES: DNA double-strand break repair nuclease NurA [unclassified Roseofilum]MBP0013375.1 DNA double-strand break repair nuclease NurA [Roseofilum sp. SID3]MBP0024176.1 DNA double-strand break repair nuclease NurA [Roseofilum sp. SID2]MBP0036419.1 DNA double-strand break repair nuclease NurA [Roseofilum sp. SID1]MBP0044060.1 DNA double-strand break repair nuclease NurA [Roseofilum sp. SBFL]